MTTTRLFGFRAPSGKCYLGLLAKRSYRLRMGQRPEVSAEQEEVFPNPVYEESTNAGAYHRLVHDSDRFCFDKPLTDVLVYGSAYSTRGPVRSLLTSVEVGKAKKEVRVTGERRVTLGASGKIGFSTALPFVSMPLTWDQAFGGRDVYAEAKLSDIGTAFQRSRGGLEALAAEPKNPKEGGFSISYPRNISGRGYFLDMDRARLDGVLLPNLEDPTDLLLPERMLIADPLDWMDLPVASCFEPLDAITFPRSMFLVPHAANPPKRPVHELLSGALMQADLDDTRFPKLPPNPRLYQCAPAGLAVCRLHGGERLKLLNLHPKHELWEVDLPAEKPQILMEPKGCGVSELSPLLQTVSVEPAEERVTLTWAATLETAAPFSKEALEGVRHAVTFGKK